MRTMPSYVVKVNRTEDFYVVWSTVTDSPHVWGTESEIIEYLLKESRYKLSAELLTEVASRFYRAKVNGTSALHLDYDWNDSFMYEQLGMLPRAKLKDFLDSFDGKSFDTTMLEPFEE